MARMTSFLLGDISGRIGDKVYYRRNGKTFVRSLTQKKQAQQTPAQQLQRERFTRMLRFCQKFKYSVIPLIWNDLAKRSSGFNLFMKTNAPAFDAGGEITDPKLIRLSMGKLYVPFEFTAKRTENNPQRVEVAWLKDMHLGGIYLWDELLAVSTANEQYSNIISTGITRGMLGGSFELPDQETPATHLYFFMASGDKRNFSDSICFEI